MNARALCLLLLLLPTLGGFAHAANDEVMVDSLVATVGNEAISIEEIQVEMDILARTKIWFSRTEPPPVVTEKDVFKELMTRALLYQQGRKMGFGDIPAERVEKSLDDFRRTFTSHDAYVQWLKANNFRDDKAPFDSKDLSRFRPIFRRFHRRAVIAEYLAKKIEIQVKLGLDDYLEANRADLKQKFPLANDEQLLDLARRRLYDEKLRAHIAELERRADIVLLRKRYL